VDIDDTLRNLRRELDLVNTAIAEMQRLSLELSGRIAAKRSTRGRKSMGHEERLVVSERMKRYWADRRQERTRAAFSCRLENENAH
jgi:hypothetical protein